MRVKTYVINLDRDEDRWEIIKTELAQTDLDYERFSAVLGKNLSEKNAKRYLKGSTFSRAFMTNFMKGSLTSHLMVYEKILNETDGKYALILEDDASIIDGVDKKTISATIDKIVNSYPSKWGVIRLYHFKFMGKALSAMAYLVSKKGAQKLLDRGSNYYMDYVMTNMANLNLYNHTPMIFTDKGLFASSNSNTASTDQTRWILNTNALNVPLINEEVKTKNVICFILILVVVLTITIVELLGRRKKNIRENLKIKNSLYTTNALLPV